MDNNLQSITRIVDYIEAHFNLSWKSLYSRAMETQQSFTVAFKALFKCSPQALRKKRNFHPLQLKFAVDGNKRLRGDMAISF